ncbi:MAG: hypothetical protein H7Y11_13220, partial [Armatimonadetes bacterium]|nr:hypothetical protein [Anaerolineae bacterium]
LTPDADTDPLNCAAEVCTLTVAPEINSTLTDGTYNWTAFADNGFDVSEAANASFGFKINTGDINLLVNGSFETLDVEGKPNVLPWTVKNATGDKAKCDKEGKPAGARTGVCAFRFKGGVGEASKLTQTVSDNPVFSVVGVGVGDTVFAEAFVNTLAEAPGKLTLKVKYVTPTAGANGDGKDKISVDLAPTADIYTAFSTTPLVLADAVTSVKVSISFKGIAGKMLVDDVTFTREGLDITVGLTNRGGGLLELPKPQPGLSTQGGQ